MAKKTPSIRADRSAIAKLKRAGLVHPGIDARSVQINRTLRSAINKFKDVIAGRAKTIPLAKLNIGEREVKRRNIQLSKPIGLPARVIIPHFPSEKVTVKGGNINFHSPEGIRRLELPPVRSGSVRQFFADLKKNKVRLPDKRQGQFFAARYYSGRTAPYQSLHDLLNTLNAYDSSVTAHGRKQTDELIRNIEIFSLDSESRQQWFDQRRQDREIRKEKRDAIRNKKRAKKRRAAAKKKASRKDR